MRNFSQCKLGSRSTAKTGPAHGQHCVNKGWPSKDLQLDARRFEFERQIVCCPHCRTRYVLIQRETPPGIIPDCGACGQEFLAKENGNWLMYEQVESE